MNYIKRIEYIVDFEKDGVLYEIKPNSEINSEMNFVKFIAAKEFSSGNFKIITEKYFIEHLTEIKEKYNIIKKNLGEKLKEQLNNLQFKMKEMGLFFQITFYGENSFKVAIFKKEKIIKIWYKNSLEKLIKSIEDYDDV